MRSDPLRKILSSPDADGNASGTLPNGWHASAKVGAAESLAASVESLTLKPAEPLCGDPKDWADRLSGQRAGLREPLQLVENDSQEQTATMRSAVPHRDGGEIRYDEVTLHPVNGAVLTRYKATACVPGREAEAVPATYEDLGRWVDACTGTAGE